MRRAPLLIHARRNPGPNRIRLAGAHVTWEVDGRGPGELTRGYGFPIPETAWLEFAETFRENADKLVGVRVDVTPTGPSFARDGILALQQIEYALWHARVAAPQHLLLTADEEAQLQTRLARIATLSPGVVASRLREVAHTLTLDADPTLRRSVYAALGEGLLRLDADTAERTRRQAEYVAPTPDERQQKRQEQAATRTQDLAAKVQAARAAVQARHAEVRAYVEDTKTGPRPKMPPALELDRLVQGPGAAFTVREDPPKMLGNEVCGNPVDGKAYFFVVTKQTRALTSFVPWAEIESQAAQHGLAPEVQSLAVPVRASVPALTVLAYAVRQAYPAAAQLEIDIIAARGLVSVGKQVFEPSETLSVPKEAAQSGVPAVAHFLAPSYLQALHRFVIDVYLPANNRRAFLSTEGATHIGKQKTTAKARRGLKPAGGLLAPKGLQQKSSVYEQAELIGNLNRTEAATDFLTQELSGRSRAPQRAATASWRGDMRTSYTAYDPETGRLQFLRYSSKASLALDQFRELNPYGDRDFVVQAAAPLTEALVQAAAAAGTPVHRFVADMLVISSCVRINESIVLDATMVVPQGAKVSIRCAAKATSVFYSWVPSTLPSSDVDADCITRSGQQQLIEEAASSPLNYLVFKTYNPILFETTRQLWTSKYTRARRPWETPLAQFRMLQDIDILGRYGTALSFAQWAVAKAPSSQRSMLLQHVFAPAVQVRTLRELLSGNTDSARAFVQMWALGASLVTARAEIDAFVLNPVGWTQAFKRSRVDTAVPRLMRTAQIGVPATKAIRLKPNSAPADLRTALYLAVTGSPPGGPSTAAQDATLLRRFQAQPPTYVTRGRAGVMEAVTAEPLPPTGTFDDVTVALLNRVLNAPRPLPRGARVIPENLDLSETTSGRVPGVLGPARTDSQRALLALLQDQVAAIDEALAALPPPPYLQRAARQVDAQFDIGRPGRKRGGGHE